MSISATTYILTSGNKLDNFIYEIVIGKVFINFFKGSLSQLFMLWIHEKPIII